MYREHCNLYYIILDDFHKHAKSKVEIAQAKTDLKKAEKYEIKSKAPPGEDD